MVGNKKLLGLLVLAIFSVSWVGVAAKKLATVSKVANNKKSKQQKIAQKKQKPKKPKRTIIQGDFIVQDAKKKPLFQILSKMGKVVVNSGTLSVGQTIMNAKTGNVSVSGKFDAREALANLFNSPGGMAWGDKSLRLLEQFYCEGMLPVGSGPSPLITISVPEFAATQTNRPFLCLVDLLYMADAYDESGQTFIAGGFYVIKLFIIVINGELFYTIRDHEFNGYTFVEQAFDLKIARLVAPVYHPDARKIILCLQNAEGVDLVDGGDLYGESESEAVFMPIGMLKNQFIHVELIANVARKDCKVKHEKLDEDDDMDMDDNDDDSNDDQDDGDGPDID